MRAAALTLTLAAVGCAGHHESRGAEPPPVDVSRSESEPAAPAGSEVARTERWSFHSNLLFNLHHFVFQCAKTLASRDGEDVPDRPVAVAEIGLVDALAGTERETWYTAIGFYRREAIARDLLFDGTMYRLKQQLTAIDDPLGEWPAELDVGYAGALRAALPVYRTRFWPAHDRSNRAWIAAATSRLGRYEATLASRLERAYGGRWPAAPVRVDVCAYANWAGAYTTGGPAHVTLSSTDPNARGDAALETLFHEVSHTREMFGPLRAALASAFEAIGAEAPRDLWHLLMFEAAGEAVRRTLAADGIAGYVHYGDRTGMYRRGAWATHQPLVSTGWRAFLDGSIDRATALARIAAAVSSDG